VLVQDPVTFNGHINHSFYIKSSFSPDDRYIVSGDSGYDVCIWDVKHPLLDPLRLKGHRGEVSDVKWCPTDLSMLASCSDDGSVRIWKMDRFGHHDDDDSENDTDDFFEWGAAEFSPSWNMQSSRSEDDRLECLLHLRDTSWLSTLPGAHQAPRQLHGVSPQHLYTRQEAKLGLQFLLAVVADGGPAALLSSRLLAAVLEDRGPAALRASRLLAALLAEASRLLAAVHSGRGRTALLASRLLAAVLSEASRLFAAALADGAVLAWRLDPAVFAQGGLAAVLALQFLATLLAISPVPQFIWPHTRSTSTSPQCPSPRLTQATLDDLWQLRGSGFHWPVPRRGRVGCCPGPRLKQTTLDDLWQLRRSSFHRPVSSIGRVGCGLPGGAAMDGLPCAASAADCGTSALGPAPANERGGAAGGGKRRGGEDLGDGAEPTAGPGSRKRARPAE
jgi:hypothetical protein